LALTGEDLLTFITLDEDPYKWYNTMNEMLWYKILELYINERNKKK
jgi:hypothetical protein